MCLECCTLHCHWILPENSLNAGMRFAGNPTGSQPKFMPWDNALLKYLVDAVMYHIGLTSHLLEKRESDLDHDECKFLMTKPAALSKCYQRLLTAGFPSADQIEHDVKRVMDSIRKVVEGRGVVLPGLAPRNGHRRETTYSNWGGSQKRGNGTQCDKPKDIHPHAERAFSEMKKEVEMKVSGEKRVRIEEGEDLNAKKKKIDKTTKDNIVVDVKQKV